MGFQGKRFAANEAEEAPAALLYPVTANRKLAPVEMVPNDTDRLRPVPVGPFVASTYVSLKATCPSSCPFRENGCYVTSGFYAPVAQQLDAAAENLQPSEVIEQEAHAIEQFARIRKRGAGRVGIPADGGKNGDAGRDLRLHVGGDVPDEAGARRLAKSATIWRIYGGGRVWTYTHRWRKVRAEAWGEISALASVETAKEAREAHAKGYAAAIVVSEFPEPSPGKPNGSVWKKDGFTYIPCPAETRETSCVKCRLCFDAGALRKRQAVIAFHAHGLHSNRVRDAVGKKVRRLDVVK